MATAVVAVVSLVSGMNRRAAGNGTRNVPSMEVTFSTR